MPKRKTRWIKEFDGTPDCAEKISAQSKRGAIWVVAWTPGQHRVVPTRIQAEKSMMAWRKWKLRHGYKQHGRWFVGPVGTVPEICSIQKYDPRTRERLDV